MQWRQLSINEAEAHPLYGVKGWLLVFLTLFALGGVLAVAELILPTPTGYASLFGRYAREVAWVDAIAAFALVAVAGLGFARSPLFGALVVPVLLLRFLGVALVAATFAVEAMSGSGAVQLERQDIFLDAIVTAVVICAIGCGLLCWYFTVSERVNVTYRYRTRVPDRNGHATHDPWARLLD